MRHIPLTGQVYRHFKGDTYQITGYAVSTETGEQLVTYTCIESKDNSKLYVNYARELKEFMSKTDRKKYPNATQEYRFELLEEK